MREQRVILKYDAELACPWRPFRHVVAPEPNPTPMRLEETRNQFQQSGLAAAGRAYHRAEFAWRDTQRDIVDAARAGTTVAIREIFDRDAHVVTRPARAEPKPPSIASSSSSTVPAQAKPVAP